MRRIGVVGRNGVLTIAMILGLGGGPAPGAGAASIVESYSYTAPLISNTQPGFVPFFDPALGTLAAVTVTASGDAWGEIDPAAPVVPQYSGTYQCTVSFLGFDATGVLSPDLGTYYGPLTPFVSSRGGMLLPQDHFVYSATITDPRDLASFVGTGRFNFQVAARFDLHDITSPSIPVLRFVTPLVEGSASVTYFIAPEPASLVSMSLGLVPVAGLAWKRRRTVR